jgi:hypothetical protein
MTLERITPSCEFVLGLICIRAGICCVIRTECRFAQASSWGFAYMTNIGPTGFFLNYLVRSQDQRDSEKAGASSRCCDFTTIDLVIVVAPNGSSRGGSQSGPAQ